MVIFANLQVTLKKETIRPKIKPSKLNAPEREDTEEDGRKAKRKSRKGIEKIKRTLIFMKK